MTDEIVAALTREGRLVGLPNRRISGDEWGRIVWPPCPKCGEPVEADRIDMRQWGDQPFMTYYVPGTWGCPNEHDLRTAP